MRHHPGVAVLVPLDSLLEFVPEDQRQTIEDLVDNRMYEEAVDELVKLLPFIGYGYIYEFNDDDIVPEGADVGVPYVLFPVNVVYDLKLKDGFKCLKEADVPL